MNIFIFSHLYKFITSYNNKNKNVNYKESVTDILKDISMSMSMSISKNTLLEFAISFELIEEVEYLLENGADPNQDTEDGVPLLCKACLKNNINLVYLLVKYGAEIKKKDKKGNNVLHYVGNNKDIEKYLLYKGI